MPSTPAVAFYFDPISPYAWLAGLQVGRLDEAGIALDFRPVLFAGLLAAHGTKGPAEIPAKRAYTFRDVMRQAQSLGAQAEGPPAHPFNPLRALRMCIALDDGPARRRFGLALMDAAWGRGLDLAAPEQLVRIADENQLRWRGLVAARRRSGRQGTAGDSDERCHRGRYLRCADLRLRR